MEILGSILAIVFTLFLVWCIAFANRKPRLLVQHRPSSPNKAQGVIVVNIPSPALTGETEEKLKRCAKCHNLKTFGGLVSVSQTRGSGPVWLCSYCIGDNNKTAFVSEA